MRWNDSNPISMLPDAQFAKLKEDPDFKIDLGKGLLRTFFNIYLVMAFALKFIYLMRINPKFGLLN